MKINLFFMHSGVGPERRAGGVAQVGRPALPAAFRTKLESRIAIQSFKPGVTFQRLAALLGEIVQLLEKPLAATTAKVFMHAPQQLQTRRQYTQPIDGVRPRVRSDE